MRKLIETALESCLPLIEDYLPPQIFTEENLPALDKSIRMIHNPQNLEEQEKARNRISFDEVLMLQLGLLKRKQNQQKELGTSISTNEEVLEAFANRLPFTLTKDQKKSISEIGSDMNEPVPMMRLLQGDVGSGKTLVALLTMLLGIGNGFQAALMAPTEILAIQHFESISKLMEKLNVRVALLTGSTKKKDRVVLHEALQSGEIDILIGTHALLEDVVQFKNLGIVWCLFASSWKLVQHLSTVLDHYWTLFGKCGHHFHIVCRSNRPC